MSESLYHAKIKELAGANHGHGTLPDADATIRVDNPLCGDRIDLQVKLNSAGQIVALAHIARGCLLCRAAASLLGLRALDEDVGAVALVCVELQQLLTQGTPATRWPELIAFEPVRYHRSRHGCVLLPFDALRKTLIEQLKI